MIEDKNDRYRQAAEYDTTVKAALSVAGELDAEDCLYYELKLRLALYPYPTFHPDNNTSEPPEFLSNAHPNYDELVFEHQKQLRLEIDEAYSRQIQSLTDEWADARNKNPPNVRLQLAHRLNERARQLITIYKSQLIQIEDGRSIDYAHPLDTTAKFDIGPHKNLSLRQARGTGAAAALTHFRELLAEFHYHEIQSRNIEVPVKSEGALAESTPLTSFDSYLKEEYRDKLLPFLKGRYTDSKPQMLTCMLYALSDLGILLVQPAYANQTYLHEALQYFGNIGTRQALNNSITKFNNASEEQQRKIERQRRDIKAFINRELR